MGTSRALRRTCLEEAPNLITYDRDETVVHFSKQPETSEETDAVQRATEVALRSRLEMTDAHVRPWAMSSFVVSSGVETSLKLNTRSKNSKRFLDYPPLRSE